MIPIRDVIPSRTTPYVTIALIVLNVLTYLWMPSTGTTAFAEVVGAWGVRPSAVNPLATLTALFLHAGMLHLGLNMLLLWLFGDNVEDRMGHGRFLVFYLLCGVGAALLEAVVATGADEPMVGANGAVAGVLGAYLVLFPKSRVLVFAGVTVFEVPAALLIGLWFATQLLAALGALVVLDRGDLGGVTFRAQVGAAALGAALVLLFRRPERMRVEWWDQVNAR